MQYMCTECGIIIKFHEKLPCPKCHKDTLPCLLGREHTSSTDTSSGDSQDTGEVETSHPVTNREHCGNMDTSSGYSSDGAIGAVAATTTTFTGHGHELYACMDINSGYSSDGAIGAAAPTTIDASPPGTPGTGHEHRAMAPLIAAARSRDGFTTAPSDPDGAMMASVTMAEEQQDLPATPEAFRKQSPARITGNRIVKPEPNG